MCNYYGKVASESADLTPCMLVSFLGRGWLMQNYIRVVPSISNLVQANTKLKNSLFNIYMF